jgi:hypothetical protein
VEAAPSAGAAELQKAVQNPVASLISVPVQNNSNFGVGDYNRTQNVLNIQPVIPGKLTENWNYIARIIQPIIWQPYPSQTTGGEFGFGDMNPTFFISPSKPGKLIWGAGPALVIPTATRKIQHWAILCRAHSAGTLDAWWAYQQCLVGSGIRRSSGREPNALPILC